MKRTSFFVFRWWNGLGLQARLFVIFTSLFIFSILVLSYFLLNLIRLSELNRQVQAIYERNHALYELKSQVGLYELNSRQFEANASQLAEQELFAIAGRMSEKLAEMRRDFPPAYHASLDNFQGYQEQLLATMSNDITPAVYQQDRMMIEIGDVQAREQIDLLYQETVAIQKLISDELQAIQAQAGQFKTDAERIQWLAILLYVLLAILATQLIYGQIAQPLGALTRASEELLAGRFDPARLEKLARRTDEIGVMTREFLGMAANLQLESSRLRQEAAEIRAKIR